MLTPPIPARPQPLSNDPLPTRIPTYREASTFLVFCEGARTEVEYLKALKRAAEVNNAALDLRIDYDTVGSVPLTLVTAATEAVSSPKYS